MCASICRDKTIGVFVRVCICIVLKKKCSDYGRPNCTVSVTANNVYRACMLHTTKICMDDFVIFSSKRTYVVSNGRLANGFSSFSCRFLSLCGHDDSKSRAEPHDLGPDPILRDVFFSSKATDMQNRAVWHLKIPKKERMFFFIILSKRKNVFLFFFATPASARLAVPATKATTPIVKVNKSNPFLKL